MAKRAAGSILDVEVQSDDSYQCKITQAGADGNAKTGAQLCRNCHGTGIKRAALCVEPKVFCRQPTTRGWSIPDGAAGVCLVCVCVSSCKGNAEAEIPCFERFYFLSSMFSVRLVARVRSNRSLQGHAFCMRC
jgi:hypothetical protein